MPITRDHTKKAIRNLQTPAAHPQLGDAYKRIGWPYDTLHVFEIARLENGMVFVGLQSATGIMRGYVQLVDLEAKYEAIGK